MYIRKSNNKIHAKYTNEEKERIVLLYLNHQMGVTQIVREFKLYSDKAVYRWVKIYKKYGHIIETKEKLQNSTHLIKVALENILKNL